MKTSLIFIIGFAVFAVAAARVPPKEAEDEEDDEQQEYKELTFEDVSFDGAAARVPAKEAEDEEDDEQPEYWEDDGQHQYKEPTFEFRMIWAAEWAQNNDPEYQKAVSTSSQPTAEQESINGVPSPIPSPNSLALKSDPIALGEKLARFGEDERHKYTERMVDLIIENADTVQSEFYEAALQAIDSPEQASQEWNETVQNAKDYGKKMAENFPEIDNLFDDNTRLTIVNSILKADPLRKAEALDTPIMLHIGIGSSGSLVVASSFNTLFYSYFQEEVEGSIQRLILDRIEERGGVDEFYKKHFSSPAPNSEQ